MGFGRYGLLPAFRRDPRCRVVAVAARSRDKAAAFAESLDVPRGFGDWRTLLDEASPDAIAIATPPADQPDIAAHALRMGIAVFAEKPLALNLEQALDLARTAQASGRPNVVDFIFPELKTWQLAKKLLDDGTIGRLRHFAVDWRMETFDNRMGIVAWKTDASKGGGVLQHFGCHTLHYVEHLFGSVTEVSATLTSAGDLGDRGDTLASLCLKLDSGLSGTVCICSAATHASTHRLEIYGSDGCLVLENTSSDPVSGFELRTTSRTSPEHTTLATEEMEQDVGEDSRVGPVSLLASRFLDWCIAGIPTTPSFQEGLRVQQLIAAARQSSAAKRLIDVAAPLRDLEGTRP